MVVSNGYLAQVLPGEELAGLRDGVNKNNFANAIERQERHHR